MPKGLLGAISAAAHSNDIALGISAARQLGGEDRGQAVVVRKSQVIAEEGPDGTDAMLMRLANAENHGGVLCKTLKPGQERRADLPTVGPTTVENAAHAGLDGIAVEAQNAFLIEKDATIDAANARGIFILGVTTDKL